MSGTKGHIPGTKPLPTVPPPKAPIPHPAPGSRVYRLTPEERDQMGAISFCAEHRYGHIPDDRRERQMLKDIARLLKIIGYDHDDTTERVT